MLISELIWLLENRMDKYGDVTVCVWDDAFHMPNTGICPRLMESELFSDDCEVIRTGDFLLL